MALDAIVAHKRTELDRRKQQRPLRALQAATAPSERSFEAALHGPGRRFIFECKRSSPSRGLIRADFDPRAIAASYAPYADAVSVLTDSRFFGGELSYLTAVSREVSAPVLAKDFVLEPYQVYEARHHGADAVLLILAVLGDPELEACRAAARSLGMGVLAEVHGEEELARALSHDLPVIGINSRDLKTLKVDLSVVKRLAPRVPSDRVVVAESGISGHRDLVRLDGLADAFLIGSQPMSEPDIAAACRKIVFGPVKVCGLTRPEDAAAAQRFGATFGGLVFAEESPRRVDPAKAAAIRRAADLGWVGVFVNEAVERVAELARALSLFAVQLHGEEGPDYVASLRRRLPEAVEVWKAVRVKDRVPALGETGADRLLLDSYKSGMRGGTGAAFDWSLLAGSDLGRTVLSGGLGPGNAAGADRVGAFALDVNSGVEAEPGIKSQALLAAFFAALRGGGRRDR